MAESRDGRSAAAIGRDVAPASAAADGASSLLLSPFPQLQVPKLEPDSCVPSQQVHVKPKFEPKDEPILLAARVKAEDLPSSSSLLDSDQGGEEEDPVVREIDLFLSPTVDGGESQLYLLQYPLRPAWRPYGLEERCQEVRVKPQQSKLEVDLVVDTTGENYDTERESHLQITKQTLTSSRVALNTNYAVGVLRHGQLHLNPIKAVVQLRPSMKYIDDADVAKKKQNREAGITDGDDEEMVEAEASESKSELTLLQSWIPLEPHGVDSPLTDGIRQKMVASTKTPIPFTLRPYETHFSALPPGICQSLMFEFGFLNTLSLEDRFHVLLSKGRVQVLQFERLMKLAPMGCTEAEVLDVLQQKALLVQGCWVAASFIRYEQPLSIIRDYILSLFNKNRVVLHEQLEDLPISKEALREIMLSLAVQRSNVGWEFQESTDRSFIKKHQGVAKAQANQWVESAEGIREAILELNSSTPDAVGAQPMDVTDDKRPLRKGEPSSVPRGERWENLESAVPAATRKPAPLAKSQVVVADDGRGPGQSGLENGEFAGQVTMSQATQAALPGALKAIFLKHNVCRLQLICQSLRDMAIESTATNSNPKVVAAAVAAAMGANAPLPELAAAVSKIASNIENVYFLSSLGNPSLDPFRNVVIALLRAKGPNAGLRRSDIMEASKIALRSEVPGATYQKVLKELCYTRGGAWVLKPGDGRPT
ncbi:unnamed protein product [Sphagnum troendelagicum]|uniref:DNA-directed RNA polymerase III subunit RPC5 n=1 Tax=Sphagnum troendelagicum TaxID=128251 RepID=A0ABP0U090_9BRYO